MGIAAEIIQPTDFWKPVHGNMFAAIIDLYEHGDPIDAVTVQGRASEMCLTLGTDMSIFIALQANVPSIANVREYCQIVERASVARNVMRAAQQALSDVTDGGDPFVVADEMNRFTLGIGSKDVVQQAQTVEEMLNSDESVSRTIISGLFKEDYRVILTARSGTGKSTFTRFVGFCASQGIHPFTRQEMTPIRVLAVDAENPMENILQVMKPLRATLMDRSGVYKEDRFRIWRKPGGISIRNRRDRTDLQREIAFHRPDLVIAGPAYKLGVTRQPGESWEEAAGDWLDVWDKLRTNFSFALFLEAHTSKSEAMDPQGSGYITQWCETGLAMQEDKQIPGAVDLERFRGDRLQGLTWPKRLERDPDWLWRAVF